MKITLATLVLLIGLSISKEFESIKPKWKWPQEMESVFEYEGRLLTGIPQLAPQYSGLGIRADVVVQQEREENQENVLVNWILIRNPKFVDVNHKLEVVPEHELNYPSQLNWRTIPLPPMQEVPSEVRSYLELPFKFLVDKVDGSITNVVISADEPTWSINFKKALAVLFQLKLDQSSSNLVTNQLNNLHKDGQHQWITVEESMDGLCETNYRVNELPLYLIREQPYLVPHPQVCTDSKLYEVTKVKNVESCQQGTQFMFQKESRVEAVATKRSSETKYVACMTRNGLVLQTVINTADMNHGVLGSKLEKLRTGVKQSLILKGRNPKSQIISVKNEKKYNLRFEIPISKSFVREQYNGFVPMPSMHNNASIVLPRNLLCPEEASEYQLGKVSEGLLSVLHSIVEQMLNSASGDGVKLSELVMITQRGLGLLRFQDLKQLSDKFERSIQPNHKSAAREIFIDLVAMTGTVHTTKYILQNMQHASELSYLKKITTLSMLPSYIVTPTQEILKAYFELVTSPEVRQQEYLYNVALLGLSSLVQHACLSESRLTRYPTQIYGEFCSPTSDIVTGKLLPLLMKPIYDHDVSEKDKLVSLVALRIISHRSVVPYLTKVILSPQVPSEIRSLSIYALANSAKLDSRDVVHFVYSLFATPGEESGVRIAAFNVLLSLNPSMSLVNQIASNCYFERNPIVFKSIISTLYTLSEVQQPANFQATTLSLSRKVRLVKWLLKKLPTVFTSTGQYVDSTYFENLGLGYETITGKVSELESFLPKELYKKVTFVNDLIKYTPIEISASFNGLQSLFDNVIDTVFQYGNNVANTIEYNNIKKLIKVHQAHRASGNSYVYSTLFEHIHSFVSWNQVDTELVQRYIQQFIKRPEMFKHLIQGKKAYNLHQIISLHPTEMFFPTEIGFPISLMVNSLSIASINGELSVSCSSDEYTVKLSGNNKLSSGIIGQVSVYSPFSKDIISTGVNQMVEARIPLSAEVKLNTLSGEMSIKVIPVPLQVKATLLNLVVQPFTSSKGFESSLLGINSRTKIIKGITRPDSYSYSSLKMGGVSVHTDIDKLEYKELMWELYPILTNIGYNPINILRFVFLNPTLISKVYPTISNIAFKVDVDPTLLSTEEIKLSIKLAFAKRWGDSKMNVIFPNSMKSLYKQSSMEASSSRMYRKSTPAYNLPKQDLYNKLEDSLKTADIEDGISVNLEYNVTMNGQQQKQASQELILAVGVKDDLWSYMFKIQSSLLPTQIPLMICSQGTLSYATHSKSKVQEFGSTYLPFQWKLHNILEFGNTCKESQIVVTLKSNVIPETPLSQLHNVEAVNDCRTLINRMVPNAALSYPCINAKKQLKMVNHIDAIVEYKNVPKSIEAFDQATMYLIKILGWPYMQTEWGYGHQRNGYLTTHINAEIDEETRKMNLTIQRPEENLVFSNIYLPFPMLYIQPFFETVSLKAISLLSVKPKHGCMINKSTIVTFENKKLPVVLDDSYYMVTADCSSKKYFSVLAKLIDPTYATKEVKVYIEKHTITMTPISSYLHARIAVFVDGKPLSSEKKKIITHEGTTIALIEMKLSGLALTVPGYIKIFFNGTSVYITLDDEFRHGTLCGLCGKTPTEKSQITVQSSDQYEPCQFSTSQIQALHYRVDGEYKGNLQNELHQQYVWEKYQCKQKNYQLQRTELASADVKYTCGNVKHMILEHNDELCMSKLPLLQCLQPMCRPRGMIEEEIEFVCINYLNKKMIEQHMEKIDNHQNLDELRRLPTDFATRVHVASACQKQ